MASGPPNAPSLPEAPQIDRRIRIPAFRAAGLLAIALVPVLALFGVFGERGTSVRTLGELETVVRVAFVHILLMATLRVMGKRELGRLSPFELVLLMLIPELFQQALLREDFSMTNAVIAFFHAHNARDALIAARPPLAEDGADPDRRADRDRRARQVS